MSYNITSYPVFSWCVCLFFVMLVRHAIKTVSDLYITISSSESLRAQHSHAQHLCALCCRVFVSLQHCSKSTSTSWMWLLRSSVIIANKPWPRITLTMTTTALILIMAVFNMVSFHALGLLGGRGFNETWSICIRCLCLLNCEVMECNMSSK